MSSIAMAAVVVAVRVPHSKGEKGKVNRKWSATTKYYITPPICLHSFSMASIRRATYSDTAVFRTNAT